MLLAQSYPVTSNTHHVGPGTTFIAIKGFKLDGTSFIPEALDRGATSIVVEETSHTPELEALCKAHNASYTVVPNARKALANLAAKRLGYPSTKLKIVGITGTKGKSTTAFLVEHLLRKAGHKTALISTIYNKILDQREDSDRTTPEVDYLQMFFATCLQRGVEYVVMEVSSHALSLQRVHGITFDAIGFTNLAPEHLDFYGTMEAYFEAKASLFSHIRPGGTIVINTDNDGGTQALQRAQQAVSDKKVTITPFGTQSSEQPGYCPMDIHQATCDGIELILDMQPSLFLQCPQLFGVFNCYNIAMASLIAKHLGVSYSAIARGLETFKGVPGRLQRHVLKNGALAFVDYAHNASSMQEILTTLRPFTQHLIVVFGCGGDRDKTKRPMMGQLAGQYGDLIIVTDDNPRHEDRNSIHQEILAGIPAEQKNKVVVLADRKEAITYAVQHATPHSIVALLGKGHETYYISQDVVSHFDDFEEIIQF